MAQATLPPGPAERFSLRNIRAFNADDFAFLIGLRAYGDLTSFMFGPFRVYVANSPDAFRDVLVAQADRVNKSLNIKVVLNPLLGRGIFTSEGDFWKAQRKLVAPAFHTRRIGAYAETIVGFSEAAIGQWRSGQTIDIEQAMADVTMASISKILFNADVSGDTAAISAVVNDALRVVNGKLGRIGDIPLWIPIRENRIYKRAIDRLFSLIDGIIAERRTSGEDRGDVLSMLLAAQTEDGSRMDDAQVRSEAITLFVAGFETTAVTLTWALYLLSQHPEVMARLQAEVDGVLAGRAPTLEDLAKLPYTEQVIKETMRLYPAAWGLAREATEPIEVAGYTLKKGAIITLPIYTLHRDPRWWPEPERFDPDRFAPEREQAIPRYAYLPFGGGPRVCVGNALAMMEARLVLASVVQRFALDLAPGQEVAHTRMFTLRPKHGMRMVARAR